MPESVTQLIQLARGQRGRLLKILQRLQAGEQLPMQLSDWPQLAHELQRLGCFAQVLELSDLADAIGVEDFDLLAKAATAASNLGLTGSCVEKLERAVRALPEEASSEIVEEVLGSLGRQYKDWALKSDDEIERTRLLRKSLSVYERAFNRTMRLWSGVNVASVCLLLGDEMRARELAERLSADAGGRFRDAMAGDGDEEAHWLRAVQGECALILGQLAEAGEHYAVACSIAERRRRLGDVASMRRQARLLLRKVGADPGLAQQWLPRARIAVFSGHLVDAPDRPLARFPADRFEIVAAAMSQWMKENDVRIAVCSLSAGADLLFAEAVVSVGAELHIVLPAGQRELKQLPLLELIREGSARVQRVVASATSIRELGPAELTCEAADYVYLNEMMLGTAEFLRQTIDGEVRGLTVWDGGASGGPGGTVDAIRGMLVCGWPVQDINPHNGLVGAVTRVPAPTDEFIAVSSQLKALFFGDFFGYSKLCATELREFHEHVMTAVGRVVEAIPREDAPSARNTWGDGLFLAFPSTPAAARFALRLQAELVELGAQRGGVASQTLLRVALHYGPTIEIIDPLTNQPNVVGTHVSQAARLEPATAPGEVYASEAFASRLMLERDTALECRYLKNLRWAKNYGVFPTFRLVQSECA